MGNAGIKGLAKDTAIYGVSSIIGKFFNWLLVPLYSYTITKADYGVVTGLYAWIALIIVIITYGMETGYFRFAAAAKDKNGADTTYSTTMISIISTSIIFMLLFWLFLTPISNIMELADYKYLVMLMAATVSVDAFSSIPFAYLRHNNRPIRFMILKLIIIITNIAFNIFFLVLCPYINKHNPELISWCYNPHYKVEYIVISNFLSSFICLLFQIPDLICIKWRFDFKLLHRMLKYSLPLLLLGITGIMNQTFDRLIFPVVYQGGVEGAREAMGEYQACFKIAMVMMMFTYAFRFAYEPFIFAKKKDSNSKQIYSQTMTYFVITTAIIYLMLITGLDVLQLLLQKEFRSAINIIPFVLITYSFQGIYYNLSLWYKLTDRTIWGTYISFMGMIITLIFNIIFIPLMSYWACVYASMISFATMMLVCYFMGQKHYPIKYELKKIGLYFVVSIAISMIMILVKFDNLIINLSWRLLWFIPFIAYVLTKELPTKEIIEKIKQRGK